MRSNTLFAFLSLTAFAASDLAAPLPASGDRMPAGERAELIFERPNPVPPWAPTTYTTSSSTSTSASSGSSTGMILIRLDNHMDHNVDDNLDHDLDGHRDAVYHPRR
ncbi:hypothetical protein NEMBOFW57_001422 [Staphylotrichum longicolle]|uniref:Uncharacterized protein n=1 Tax=Staphylotrichum longicolle TaxID=669026 RepID=A0AAD4F162_9PEZI|nr:hypothetical protein NEMBOFW57_001422 [Staphylotrichum longicolle]